MVRNNQAGNNLSVFYLNNTNTTIGSINMNEPTMARLNVELGESMYNKQLPVRLIENLCLYC